MNKIIKLKFSRGNAKLKKDTAIFSLPAGHTCPAAMLCKSMSNRITGKLTDGKDNVFRCYAATGENFFKNVRKSRWNNFEALKSLNLSGMINLIETSLPRKGIKLVRIHSSGDFFSQTYFDAWLQVAIQNPNIIFYGYTKSLPFWVARLDDIPKNFRLVASKGGRFDSLIQEFNLKSVLVVDSLKEARDKKLSLDHDDTHVWKGKKSFAILLHGTQPAGPKARIIYALRKKGLGGYKADYFKDYKK